MSLVAVHGADPRVAGALHRYMGSSPGKAVLAGSGMVVIVSNRRRRASTAARTFYVEVLDIADTHRTGSDVAADAAALVWHLLFKAIQTIQLPWRNSKGYRCAAVARRRRRRGLVRL